MKRKSVLVNILRIAITTGGVMVALKLINRINICDWLSFVPKEKKYDIGVMLYTAIIEGVIDIIWQSLGTWIQNSKTTVKAIIYPKNHEPILENKPSIVFGELGVASMGVRIEVSGNRKRIKDQMIRICAQSQVDFQVNDPGTGLRVSDNGDLCVNLSDICSNSRTIQTIEDYKVTLMRVCEQDNAKIVIEPEIVKKGRVTFFSNKGTIIVGDRR